MIERKGSHDQRVMDVLHDADPANDVGYDGELSPTEHAAETRDRLLAMIVVALEDVRDAIDHLREGMDTQ